MNARAGDGTLMDAARTRALEWLSSIPSADRVMLVRADALATPATVFEVDRNQIVQAVRESGPGDTALDLDQAIAFAQRAQELQAASGEIAYVGARRVRSRGTEADHNVRNLRVITIPNEVEHVGLRRISMHRSADDESLWQILVSVRNYGSTARTVALNIGFDGSPAGSRRVTLLPRSEQEAAFTWRARNAGALQARLTSADAFPDDAQATLEAPALASIHVTVYTNRPEDLKAFFASSPRVQAEFRPTSTYRADQRGLVVLDGFRPPLRPQQDTIWINPPHSESPIPVVQTVLEPKGFRWVSGHQLGAGLRAHDMKLGNVSIYRAIPGDITVAEVDGGPVLLARPGKPKTVVLGLDPAQGAMRYQLSTPLVFANILRWLAPDVFRQTDLSVQAAGAVSVRLEGNPQEGAIEVKRPGGKKIPFTLDQDSVRFFSGEKDTVRISEPERESVISLSLPEMWDAVWEPPAGVRTGVPHRAAVSGEGQEMWPWLAVLGAGCLAVEWVLFTKARRAAVRQMPSRTSMRRAS
jgi:hypothetical protein